jgi:spore coat polysaccharide biosynthesis predicted glycosyltransferase SpsG
MSASSTLLLRADADTRIGTGHVMRCLALAQSWLGGGGEVTLLTASELPELDSRLIAEGVRIEPLPGPAGTDADADWTRATAERLGAMWVVLDGYHFSGEFQRRVRRETLRVAVIDDYSHAAHYAADLVLNQNLHATADLYRNRPLDTLKRRVTGLFHGVS